MNEVLFAFYFFSLVVCYIYIVFILCACFGWARTKTFHCSSQKEYKTRVSVILAARNEEDNIEACLKSLLSQDYPDNLFEIIVVDDNSADATAQRVGTLQQTQKNIKLIRLKDEETIVAFKKRAIAKAIGEAIGDLIVTTDADCVMHNKWLSTLACFYEKEKPKMIVGPVVFHREESVFEIMQSLEFMGLIATGAAAIYFNSPIMCNGANLAFEKNAFYSVKGYENIDNIASGDEVLLMQKMHKVFPGSIKFIKSADAIVYTKACKTISEFIQQRIRWASKAFQSGTLSSIIISGFVFFYNVFILFALLSGAFYPKFLSLFLLLFGIKCGIDFLFLLLSSAFFHKKRYLLLLLPQQFIYVFYVCVTGVWSTISKKYHWKGRLVK